MAKKVIKPESVKEVKKVKKTTKPTTKKTKKEVVSPEVETVVMNQNTPSTIESTTNLNISEEVIAIIAGIAAGEVEGVAGMSLGFVDGVSEMFGKKKHSKGVKVDIDGDSVVIDIYVIVAYGVRIPDVAWSIQTSVKANVENMTGLTVKSVNINVQGVNFDKKTTTVEEVEEVEDDDEE